MDASNFTSFNDDDVITYCWRILSNPGILHTDTIPATPGGKQNQNAIREVLVRKVSQRLILKRSVMVVNIYEG